MSVHYYPSKEKVVAKALRRLSMGRVAHAERERKKLAKDVHMLPRWRVCLISI